MRQKEPPLSGNWRHSNGFICCGTLRIAVQDFDTDPCKARKKEILDWICESLNATQNQHALETARLVDFLEEYGNA